MQKVFRREWALVGEIVVEAIFDGWPDGHLGFREQIFDRVGEQVGSGMADDVDALPEVPGLPTLLGAKGTDMLEDIVDGGASTALSSVPGMSTVTGALSCGCAVADIGGPETIKKVMNAVGSGAQQCGGLVTDLVKGGLVGIFQGINDFLVCSLCCKF